MTSEESLAYWRLWACNGQLWSARLNRGGKLTDETLLHDFNDMKFQAIAAPY